MFFLPPYIITIIKSHGVEGDCADDLSCDEGDKGVQGFSAVTTVATGVWRQAVPGGSHLMATDHSLSLTLQINHFLALSRLFSSSLVFEPPLVCL